LGVSRALSTLRDKPSDRLSERLYQEHLPEMTHLPPERRRLWAYYTLLPNIAFDIYPDCMDIFQIVPVAPGKAHLRGRAYRLPNPGRRLNTVQRLNMRINSEVQREDNFLTEAVQEGLTSRHYGAGLLSDKEICVRQFHDFIRERMPLAHRGEPPIDPILVA
jgi:phenylpropionate dioxygenase-like ring-hydroxylating dioxygenase large terminal subunit